MSHSRWSLSYWRNALRSKRNPDCGTSVAPAPVPPATTVQGTQPGWLRVLPAPELLRILKADDALDAMWRQSRLSRQAWQRDLLPAIFAMAEFVQLMPASESHHHAHAGGLLAHTLEMTLAAMTWRNGCLLPESAAIEQIDTERDQWTYVVFFAALLHDVAKPMTDLRIQWRAARQPLPLLWSPISGSLTQLAQGHQGAEYHVAFTPKHLRDYGAHSRLALTLLPLMAPDSARALLARTPQALQALTHYLGGQDKASLIARIVTRADQTSAAHALRQGSQARFDTASSVPLIELLMGALKAMLKSGALPLNRSGAAGWVYDGSLWLVAKRTADGARDWIRQHAPQESIPGENKNDRLFDAWQEYGCIQPNPHTGQAVWYVTVHGTAPEKSGGEEAAYRHDLTVLRFALDKLYDDASQWPPAMNGHIEIKARRAAKAETAQEAQMPEAETEQGTQTPGKTPGESPELLQKTEQQRLANQAMQADREVQEAESVHKTKPEKTLLRAPAFNKPDKAASPATKSPGPKPKAESVDRHAPEAEADVREITEANKIGGADDGFLDDEDSAKAAATEAKDKAIKPHHPPARKAKQTLKSNAGQDGDPIAQDLPEVRPLFAPAQQQQMAQRAASLARAQPQPQPVLLIPKLPELPGEAASRKEPSATALAFMQWLQQGLAQRDIKYNETAAPVHFVPEGMALVSPLIFKLYARESGMEDAESAGLQVQREVIKAGWHRMRAAAGKGKVNILRYEVLGRGHAPVGKLSAVVLAEAHRWVQPLPPPNPALRLMQADQT